MSQRKIIWFAIVASTFIYAAILYSLSRAWPKPGSFDDAVRGPVTLGLYAAALVDFALSFVIPGAIAEHRQRFILTMAMIEACAIFGLTAAFIAQDWRLYLAPWIVALMGFARNYPSD